MIPYAHVFAVPRVVPQRTADADSAGVINAWLDGQPERCLFCHVPVTAVRIGVFKPACDARCRADLGASLRKRLALEKRREQAH